MRRLASGADGATLPGAGRRWPALLGLAGLLAASALPARAAGIVEVTLCTDTTPVSVPGELRHAIQTAFPHDVILLPPCTITLTGAAGDNLNAGGDLDVVTVVHLQGAGVDRTILDGDGLDRVLHATGPVFTAADLTIRNGLAAADLGGGVRVESSAVALFRAAIVQNRSTGGAGGGLFAKASLVRLVDSTVAGNRVDGTSVDGGGVAAGGSSLILQETALHDNVAAGTTAARGGGVSANESTVEVHQSTLSGNRAEAPAAQGGGLYVSGAVGRLHLFLATLAGNEALGTAAAGGGLFSAGPPVSLRGTILAGSQPESCAGPGLLTSADHNLQDDLSCPFGQPGDGSGDDPLLGPLAANGGLTRTHLPLPGSPAIDHGPLAGCPGLDQRGVSRPRDGDGDGAAVCDIGAVERRATGTRRAPALPLVIDPR